MHFRKKRYIAILLLILIASGTISHAQPLKNSFEQFSNTEINHNEIIDQGLQKLCKENKLIINKPTLLPRTLLLIKLEKWYNSHPMVEFASLIETTITIKFIDGSYTLLIDIFKLMNNCNTKNEKTYHNPIYDFSCNTLGQTALILNPSEYLYGNRHCKKIINILIDKGYNIVYLANEDVDLPYIKYNLQAEIIYMNTHAGYWDIDGDNESDAVVIATGEYWTNETEEIYQFEYENQMIVEGMVGDNSFIAFTPALIDHYYELGDLPDSMVYMATCYATFDDSMANAFLDSGASAYMGWTRNTIFWTNSLTSVLAFRLFARGFTVKQVCRLIRFGSILNFLIRSKLTFYGVGEHKILEYRDT
ncbi:MAG: hypothetical protein JSW06_00340 [Thermoplasmatales archaeon]|nr:MAG: hypothetical protein JSW06_00340 [Thermoplasmatales archaeon]